MPPEEPLDQTPANEDKASEFDVLVVLPLSNDSMGTTGERADIEALAERLEEAVAAADAGAFDGDEVGGGECVLFFSGPRERPLVQALRPVLDASAVGRRARFARQIEDASGELVREPMRG